MMIIRDQYETIVASDVAGRDGLGVELHNPLGNRLAEIFRDDTKHSIEFSSDAKATIPFDILEIFVERAGDRLAE
jgi:hypothetical protein